MTAEQILELIVNCQPKQKVEIDILLKHFAFRLAALSGKLTKEEVISLAVLASHFFDRAGDEFVNSAGAEALLDSLRNT